MIIELLGADKTLCVGEEGGEKFGGEESVGVNFRRGRRALKRSARRVKKRTREMKEKQTLKET